MIWEITPGLLNVATWFLLTSCNNKNAKLSTTKMLTYLQQKNTLSYNKIILSLSYKKNAQLTTTKTLTFLQPKQNAKFPITKTLSYYNN